MKKCTHCGIDKPLADFNIKSQSADGHYSWCKVCSREHDKIRHATEEYKTRRRAYQLQWINQESTRQRRATQRASSPYRQVRRAYQKRYNAIATNRLAARLRTRMSMALRGSAHVPPELGCSIDEFKQHIECLFRQGMSWNNYGQWQLDHVRSLSTFDLSDRQQYAAAAHYSNYQPLWKADNIRKGSGKERSRYAAITIGTGERQGETTSRTDVSAAA